METPTPHLRHVAGIGLATLLAAAGPLSAQAHGDGHGHHARHADRPTARHGVQDAMLARVPSAILRQGELLELSDGQRQRLEALDDSVKAIRAAHRGERGTMHQQIASAFGEDGIDVAAYQSALRSMADRRVSARVAVARVAQRALQVLDGSQREKFLYSVRMMRRMHRMHHGGRDGKKLDRRGMEKKEKGRDEKGEKPPRDMDEKEKDTGGEDRPADDDRR